MDTRYLQGGTEEKSISPKKREKIELVTRPGGSEDVCVLHKDFVVETSVIVLENQGPLGVSLNHPSIRCLKVG